MKKLFFYIFLPVVIWALSVIIVQKIFALSPIKSYQPTYIITGNKNDQCKYQVSFRYGLLYPFNTGIFVAYTQRSKWDIYDKSSPFRETNYNPSIFWEKQNIWKFDLLRIIPYEHCSNGRDGMENRSIDRFFGEAQISYGKFLNIGLREKVGGYYAKARQNSDIRRYLGHFETEAFAQIKSQHGYLGHERLSMKGEWTTRYYWYCIEFSCRIFTTKFRPHIYIQYYRGYGEFLISYNQKSNALRAGLIFNNE